jgi:hypothetical protein
VSYGLDFADPRTRRSVGTTSDFMASVAASELVEAIYSAPPEEESVNDLMLVTEEPRRERAASVAPVPTTSDLIAAIHSPMPPMSPEEEARLYAAIAASLRARQARPRSRCSRSRSAPRRRRSGSRSRSARSPDGDGGGDGDPPGLPPHPLYSCPAPALGVPHADRLDGGGAHPRSLASTLGGGPPKNGNAPAATGALNEAGCFVAGEHRRERTSICPAPSYHRRPTEARATA